MTELFREIVEEAFNEGFQEGFQEKRREIALRMLELAVDMDVISNVTALSHEKLRELQKKPK